MNKILPLAVLLLASPAFSQGQVWYVNPDAGDDSNGGTTTLDPLRTIGVALSNAGNGDQVQLLPGILDFANDGEIFPIPLVDGVDILQPFEDPGSFILSGSSNPGACFELNAVFTAGVSLTGVTITGFDTGVVVRSGASTGGQPFEIDNCVFQGFANAGVDISLDVPSVGGVLQEIVWVTDCLFTPSSANYGVRVRVGNGAILATGLVADCTISNCDVGISMEAEPGGALVSTSSVLRNFISGSGTETAGIFIYAESGFSASASNACSVVANGIGAYASGISGFLDAGLQLHAKSLVGTSAIVSGDISHNLIAENGTNVLLKTENNGSSISDITATFVGNLITNATITPANQAGGSGNGIVLDATLPRFTGANMAPNFGDASIVFGFGAAGGRNTIENSENFDLVTDADMQNIVLLEGNFWGQSTVGGIQGNISDLGALPPDFVPFLFDVMAASVSPPVVSAGITNELTVTAGLFSAFVDSQDENATVGRMLIVLSQGATAIDLLEPVLFSDGTGFGLTTEIPALVSGLYSVVIINPGGQTAIANVRTQTSESSGSATGCFVATAVHGHYDAKEVRILRRFRDEYLLASPFGQSLVRSYYRNGPAWATWLEEHAGARAVVRAGLAPPVALASGLLAWNAWTRFAIGGLLLGFAFWLLRRSSVVASGTS